MNEEQKSYDDGIRDGKIAAIEDSIDGLREAIDGMGKAIRSEIAPMRKAVLGNGTTEGSMVSRLAVLCTKVATNRKLIFVMLSALVGVVIGGSVTHWAF